MKDLLGENVPEPTQEEQYRAYLASPAWRKRRDAAIARAGGNCERCGISRYTRRLEVHHKTYDRFGAEPPEDLIVLCEPCHKPAEAERKADIGLSDRAERNYARLLGDKWGHLALRKAPAEKKIPSD